MKVPLAFDISFRRPLLSWVFASLLVAGSVSATTKKPPPQPITLNAATSEELQLVPGIGPATADKILVIRKSYGAFKSVDDLLAIRGIGKKRLDKMRRYLVAGKPAAGVKTGGAAPKSAEPATCVACGKAGPPLTEAALPVKSVTKSAASAEKPTDAATSPISDEEPQLP